MSYNPYNPYDPGTLSDLAGAYRNAGDIQLKEIEQRYALGKAQIANSYKEALLRSGDQRRAIEEAREYHRGQLEQARAEMERIGIPKVQIDQFLAQANTEIARGELATKQYAAQGDVAYKQGVLQQQRDEMLQLGIPKLMVDRFVALSNQAIAQGKLGLDAYEMQAIGIPKMLTDRYSGEAQAAYQRGQLGLTAQQQQQQAIEQQRRYALDVAKYGTELMSQPDRYFQAQQFAAMAPRLLGQQGTAGPAGGPTPGINQMGNLLGQALEGMGPQQATPYQVPDFPTMPGYEQPGPFQMPELPTMAPYRPPPLGPMPSFPTANFQPMAPLTTPWGATVPGYPGATMAPGMPAPGPPGQAPVPPGGTADQQFRVSGGGQYDPATLKAQQGNRQGFWSFDGGQPTFTDTSNWNNLTPEGGGASGPWTTGPESLPGYGGPSGAAPAAPLDTNSPQYRQLQQDLAAGRITPEQAAASWEAARAGPAGAAGGGWAAGGPTTTGGDPNAMTVGIEPWQMNRGGTPEQIAAGRMPGAGGGNPMATTGVYHLWPEEIAAYGGPSGGPTTYGGPSAGATPSYGPAPRGGGTAGGPGYYGPSGLSENLSNLAPDEQARYRQIMATRAQRLAAGESDLGAADLQELARYQQRIAAPPAQTAPTDPRMKQIAQIARASPPSPYDGLNEQDTHTLKLMESIYRRGGAGIQGGEMERMGTAEKGFMASAGRLLGYDPEDLSHVYQSYRPAQGAANLAG